MSIKSHSANPDKMSNIESYKSVVERYYTRRYKIDVNQNPCQDVCILTHSNRISVVTLAKSHPILVENKEVIKVDFQVDKRLNRLDNKVSGKNKRGAQNVSITAPLCHVTCSDQSKYTIPAGMKGSLVEVNDNLVQKPSLMTTKTSTDGYIAIVLTYLQDHGREMEKLLTEDQYQQAMLKRAQVVQDSIHDSAQAEDTTVEAMQAESNLSKRPSEQEENCTAKKSKLEDVDITETGKGTPEVPSIVITEAADQEMADCDKDCTLKQNETT